MADGTACLWEQDFVAAGAHTESAASTLQLFALQTGLQRGKSGSQASSRSSGPTSLQAAFMLRRNCLTVPWQARLDWSKEVFFLLGSYCALVICILRKAIALQLECFPLLFSVKVPVTSIRMTKSTSFVETSCSGLIWKMLWMCIDHLLTCDSEVGWAIWAVQDDILGTDRFVMS